MKVTNAPKRRDEPRAQLRLLRIWRSNEFDSGTTRMKSRQISAMDPEQTMVKKIADKLDASGYEKLMERPTSLP